MKVLGIDPGLKGGMAMLDSLRLCDKMRIPHTGNEVRFKYIFDYLCQHQPDAIVIEKPQMRGGNRGLLTSAKNYGGIIGVAKALGIEVVEVHARTWMAHYKLPAAKRLHIERCNQMGYKVFDDGEADAVLIARWWIDTQGE